MTVEEILSWVAAEWGADVGTVVDHGHGTHIAEATRDGVDLVVKVEVPSDGRPAECMSHEARALRVADGRGYVRLYEYDESRRVMLLQRLGSPIADAGLSIEQQIRLICSTLMRTWQIAADPSFVTGEAKARSLAADVVTF